MNKKVLLIGASGSLGQELMKGFSKSYDVSGTYSTRHSNGLIHLNITNRREVDYIFRSINPGIVVITAAKTNVEACEMNPRDSFEKNVGGIENIVSNCHGRKVVFYSTDGVFDGTKEIYYETDQTCPINVYGTDKLIAESIIGKTPGSLILRSSRHYGINRNCGKYLNNIINSLSQGKTIKAPIETEGNFTFIPDLTKATLKLIAKDQSGIYNVAGADAHSLYDAAIQVAETFGLDKSLIQAVDKDFFNKSVKRPSSPLSIDKLSQENIIMRSLEEGLSEIKKTESQF